MAFDPEITLDTEWLITNSVGTYAMAGASGALHSRAHALLATRPLNASHAFIYISKVDEQIEVNGIRTPLSTNCYSLDTIHPRGHDHMTSFAADPNPTFSYTVGETSVTKTITLDESSNMTLIRYDVVAEAKGSLIVAPLMNPRDASDITPQHNGDNLNTQLDPIDHGAILTLADAPTPLMMISSGATFTPQDRWYYYFRYDRDIEQGLRGREDLYNPGDFVFTIPRKGTYTFYISFIANESVDTMKALWDTSQDAPEKLFDSSSARKKALVKNYYSDVEKKSAKIDRAVRASSSFGYSQNDDFRSFTGFYGSGTHSFRDLMISFPGIFLTTGRFVEGAAFLRSCASEIVDGIPPRYLGDSDNGFTADNGFWFTYALYEYSLATHDSQLVADLMPTIVDIGNAYLNGFGDRVALDSTMMIVTSGEGAPLTWMDGEINGDATTPRVGKPMEVNALWYNYLRFGEYFDTVLGSKSELYKKKQKFTFKQISRKVASRFGREFWNRRANFLYDYSEGTDRVEVSRGHQVFAVGLPFSVLEETREKKLLKLIESDLLREAGILTVSSRSAQYVETLPNDEHGRAIALYQGTMWPHLLEFYVRGYLRIFGTSAKVKNKLRALLDNLLDQPQSRIAGFTPQLYTTIVHEGEQFYLPEGIDVSALGTGSVLSMYKLLYSQTAKKK